MRQGTGWSWSSAPSAASACIAAKPPPAGDHRVARGTIRAGFHGAGNQVLEQTVGRNRGLELGEGRSVGRRPAHIAGREFELGQRDVADIAFGVVHVGLRDCVNAEPGGTPSPASGLAPLRLKLGLLETYRNRMGPRRLAYAGAVESIAAVTAAHRLPLGSVGLVRYPPRAVWSAADGAMCFLDASADGHAQLQQYD